VEILLGYAILAVGVTWMQRPLWLKAIGLGVLGVALTVSLTFPAYHFVVLAHLHNVVPLVFLWGWAGRLPVRARRWFRGTQVLWVLGVPALIFSGALDWWIAAAGGAVVAFAGPAAVVMSPFTPPGSAAAIGLRFLAVFAFLQTMHYFVWVAFLPRFAPEASAAFETRVPWLRGRRLWLVAGGAGALLAVLFVADYTQGRLLYSSFATYHAYLEFPVILALLVGSGPKQAVSAPTTAYTPNAIRP
jgi:hypothetical protein